MNIANVGRSSPSSQGGYGAYPSSPRSFDSNGGGTGIGSLPLVGKYFPQSLLHQGTGDLLHHDCRAALHLDRWGRTGRLAVQTGRILLGRLVL